ncbi:transmembrane and coiled-coil domain-containing protein 6 isoform X9 [Balaenoptera musculus]|uniref:Transmembrane and coiled-coil domain-containing protein 6 isoform X9 n=1 Tax=Balaenoptera musculus TaxID=9771 RepID=A0A8B8X0J6_BALMU|nr:transmembrane and coiled-coil domain-containing protein 6 isoform X9 [Balaenoptera musculus]
MPRPLTPPLPPCAVAAQSVPCSRRRGPVACSVVQVYSRSTMWSRQRGGLKPLRCGVEQLRCRRREREAALRKARREQQLVSKRLLRDEALEEAEEGCVAMIFGEAEIQQFLRLAQRGTEEKEREGALVSLRRGLQRPETQQTFISSASTDSSVLGSTLPQHMLQLLQPGPKLNLGVAVEFAWCLHYIICSQVNNALLITQGALSTLGLLLLDLAGAVQRTEDAGLELLACPVLRCLSNLLTEAAAEAVGGQLQLRDERVVAALFILLQFLLQKQPSLLPEGLWLLNNLTANSPSFCTSLLSLDLIEPLLHLLSVSNVVSVLVLTVLCNVAEKGPAYCQRLWPGPLLSSLLDTLAFSDTEVVGQSLELLQLLFLYQPGAAQAFLQQSGLQALQRHEEVAQLQDRVHALQQTALHG